MEFKLSAFGDEISQKLGNQLKVLKKFNIDFIEIRSVEDVQLLEYNTSIIKEFKKVLDDYNIKVSSLASPIGKISIRGDLKTHLEKFKRAVEIAEYLNTKYIRIFSFYIDEGSTPGNYKNQVIEELTKYTEYVKNSDIVLLHENEKHIFGDTLDRCLYIFQNLKTDKLRAVFDPANFVQCNQHDLYKTYLKLKPYIEYFHIKDAVYLDGEVVPAGQGNGELFNILNDLSKSNYNGFISLEPHLNNSLPGGGEENFQIAYDALLNLISKIESNLVICQEQNEKKKK
ncbi:sugar phosphate isomerase/epimerase family protein [Clostridium pasteurianum]|uniref:Sugar phosphate isomerase/epimerase n=1 Tax=Clostridium pasteurianum BC1 TaxID=86416 RepID=R4K8A0_CLOPA|nr:sugar phosphate isomerase/epimerase family protein [Clostridium pasteurianum]AGK99402.1 sugar phosphate isomerase/epimerase [Clostridium pasteurianum BC1]